MKGKTYSAFFVAFVFMALITVDILAADMQYADISGVYAYHDNFGPGWEDNTIKITKTGSETFSVEIVAAAKGGAGAAYSVFYGTGRIAENFLFVSNTLTHKGKGIPILFTIHLKPNPSLDDYAKTHKAPIFSKLKPGQIAIINEGNLPSQFPKALAGYWKLGEELRGGDDLLLPNGSPMFQGQFREASFNAVYTKKQAAAAPRQRGSR
jgi:hypothetical protein